MWVSRDRKRRWLMVVTVGLLAAGMVVIMLWFAPSSWVAGSRRIGTAALGWVRIHLLTVVVMMSVVSTAVSFFIALLQRVWSQRDSVGERRWIRDRQNMLNLVRNRWIVGVLEQSLAHETRIRLGMMRRPEVVAPPGMILHRIGHEPEPLPADTPLSALFNQLGGGLLILGVPGSGKTTALLELARDLLDTAQADERQPMPVVFNLSSWAVNRVPIDDWLVKELHNSYKVPHTVSKQWLAGGEFLPLLDGLDEVRQPYRTSCVEAINVFRNTHGLTPFVVCSRTGDYTELAALLQVEEAVELQPPTRQQVYDYLAAAGTALVDVQAALRADETLWELLSCPLVLNVAALAYQDHPADALRAAGTSAQRVERLFNVYTERMLEHRSGRYSSDLILRWLAWLARSMRQRGQSEFHLDRMQPEQLPTAAQRRVVTLGPAVVSGIVSGLLVGLAARLGGELAARLGVGPGVSPGIELAKGPGVEVLAGLVFTLVAVGGRRDYEPVGRFGWPWGGLGVGLGAGMVAGLVGGVVVGLVFGLVAMGVGLVYQLVHGDRMKDVRWSWPRLVAGLAVVAVVGLVGGVIGGVVAGLVVGLVAMGVGLVYELVRGDGMEGAGATINPVEELRWSQPRLGLGLGVGLLSGLAGGGFFIALVLWLYGFDVLREVVLGYGLGSGTVIAIAVVLVFVLGSGLGSGLASETITPNEGIHRSMRRGVVVGLLGLLGVVVVSVLVSVPVYALRFSELGVGMVRELGVGLNLGLRFGLVNGLLNGSVLGLVFGLAVGLEFGGIAWLRHLTLRGLLVRNGVAPWRYVTFLDNAVERLFLRRSGGSYIFVHRLLLDYFAEIVSRDGKLPVNSDASV